jgi:hypothetical protein
MKITQVRIEYAEGTARLSANVEWEDTDRAAPQVFFEVPRQFADALLPLGNCFLVAGILPALEAGERRIVVDAEVCPRLVAGLETIMRLFRYWYRSGAIAIERPHLVSRYRGDGGAAAFLTGGIDSLATLRRNQLICPRSHPESIRHLICLYGINFDSDDSPATFAAAIEALTVVAEESGAELIPVRTNARRELNPDLNFFRFKYHAALLAAAAHALGGRVTTTFIASSHDIPNLMAWGSHPLVDPHFSSADLRIYHDSVELSRLEKTRLVAGWDVGLQNIRVCPVNWPGVNCGKCEKCLRTMLALAAVGALDRCSSFDGSLLTQASARGIQIVGDNQAAFYAELIDPLRAVGRKDLADAVEFVLATYRGETGLRGTLKQLDRRYLGGGLHSLKRSVRANEFVRSSSTT